MNEKLHSNYGEASFNKNAARSESIWHYFIRRYKAEDMTSCVDTPIALFTDFYRVRERTSRRNNAYSQCLVTRQKSVRLTVVRSPRCHDASAFDSDFPLANLFDHGKPFVFADSNGCQNYDVCRALSMS